MPFADELELAAYLGDDSLDAARSTLLVEQASAAIRSYCRQTFDLVADDEVVLRGTWSDRLKLPERPVVSVSSVHIGDTAVTTWRLVRDTLVRTGPSDANFDLRGSGRGWGGPSWTVTVVYTHGFAAGTQAMVALKGVCLSIAARAVVNTSGMTSQTLGDWSASWGNGGGGFALTAAEQAVLDRYRHEYAS